MVIAPPAEAPPQEAAIRPGRGWYWLGALIVAAGIIGAITLAVVGINRYRDTIEGFGRFVAPGRAEVTFEQSGDYTIYYESESVVDGRTVDAPDDPPVGLQMALEGSSGPVAIDEEEFDEVYEVPDFHGEAVGKVGVDTPGSYVMEVTAQDGGEFAIAIGRGALRSVLPWVAGGLASFFGGLLIGGAILVVTGIRRSRSRRAARVQPLTEWPRPTPAPTPAPLTRQAGRPADAPTWQPPSAAGTPLPPPQPAPPPATGPTWAPPSGPPAGR